jgi:hypothetical protein
MNAENDEALDIINGFLDAIDRCGVVVGRELEQSARDYSAAAEADRNRGVETWEQYAEKTKRIAVEFARLLRAEIGEENYERAVKINNAEAHSDLCASHDFCDANVVMAEAFRLATGYPLRTGNDYDTTLWNDSWGEWKAMGRRGGAS